MLVSQITSGLGNQMFQYAFGRASSLEKACELKLDLSLYENSKYTAYKYHNRVFKLDHFDVKYQKFNFWDKFRFNSFVFPGFQKVKEQGLTYDSGYQNLNAKNFYFEGFWQSEKYFKKYEESIRNDFKFAKELESSYKKTENDILRAQNAVSIHVRRGDYVENKEIFERHGVCKLDYYQRAFDYLKSKMGNIRYFVFSNDMKWCKKNFQSLKLDIRFVEVEDYSDIDEMHLMSKCDHHIIANSSFSWWGAWLNNKPNKIVVAPKRWYKADYLDGSDVVPESWIKL